MGNWRIKAASVKTSMTLTVQESWEMKEKILCHLILININIININIIIIVKYWYLIFNGVLPSLEVRCCHPSLDHVFVYLAMLKEALQAGYTKLKL